VVGRKSLGSAPKRLVRDWLASRDEEQLFASSAGQSPSLSDILKMVHPKPAGPVREAFYGYMLGRSYDATALPKLVMQFERFKSGESGDVPDLPFTLLRSSPAMPAVGTERRFNGKAGIFRRHFYSGDLVEIKPLVRFAAWLIRA